MKRELNKPVTKGWVLAFFFLYQMATWGHGLEGMLIVIIVATLVIPNSNGEGK